MNIDNSGNLEDLNEDQKLDHVDMDTTGTPEELKACKEWRDKLVELFESKPKHASFLCFTSWSVSDTQSDMHKQVVSSGKSLADICDTLLMDDDIRNMLKRVAILKSLS